MALSVFPDVKSSQYSNSVGDIWTSGGGKIHDSTNSREVGSLTHGFSFLSILGALSVRKVKARFHGSRDGLTVSHTKPIEDIKAILPLGE